MMRFGRCSGWDAGVVVPARNEARRLGRCLAALDSAIGARCAGVVIVVNNSADASAAIVEDWFLKTGRSGMLVDCALPRAWSNVGRVRDIGLSLADRCLRSGGVLMTTDADCRVRKSWMAANLDELRRADVVCGRIEGDPVEAARLPAAALAHARHETSYLRAALSAAVRLDPLPHDPEPVHRSTPGASLAFGQKVYRRVGMHSLPADEDRTFVALAERADFRVRYSGAARVVASCRMFGRTGGGMAATLRHRASDPDPLCDPWLEPAETLVLRHALRGLLRRAFPCRKLMGEVLRGLLGKGDLLPAAQGIGDVLAGVEAHAPALARRRVRQSEIPRELHRLERLMAARERDPFQ
jgi:Glycosyl transferase family 2